VGITAGAVWNTPQDVCTACENSCGEGRLRACNKASDLRKRRAPHVEPKKA
jgi:hypothetical protein